MDILQNAKQKYGELLIIENKLRAGIKTSPNAKLRPRKKGNQYQYYIETKNSRKYLSKKNLEMAKKIAQYDYFRKLLPTLQKNKRALNFLILHYKPEQLTKVYKTIPQSRKLLVNPVFIDDETYAAQWQARSYEPKKDQPEENFITIKKEHVRSKSEVIIANLLNAKQIPYHYEFPVVIHQGLTLHPDFLCLNKRTRQEFYWEHCGLMSNSEYSENLVWRLSEYAKKGIFPGKNLILTMESQHSPLSVKDVEKIIDYFLV